MADSIPLSREMTFSYGEPREMQPGVRRIVANNPGPFTFKGTNTYLIGDDHVCVIDPGPDDAAHRNAILRAADGKQITHIFLTHTHRDHCDGLSALKAVTGAKTYAFDPARLTGQRGSVESSPSGSDFTDTDFWPDHPLAHGDVVKVGDWLLNALHTPGHAPDHLCFGLSHVASGETGTLISGDHVMGWSTTVVAPPEGNMGNYMRSLELLRSREDKIFLPGHGGAIRTPQRVVKAYIMHRRWRESAILDCIRDGVADIDGIVARCYPSLDASLIPAAGLSVLAHVGALVESGAVSSSGPVTMDAHFSAA
ncbi:MAG: MBL fold metallo-hydrolase [Pseudomonadota bacterium]